MNTNGYNVSRVIRFLSANRISEQILVQEQCQQVDNFNVVKVLHVPPYSEDTWLLISLVPF